MSKNAFMNWLDDLDIQTLTEELKEEIKEKAEEAFAEEMDDSYNEGYMTCKQLIEDFINDDL